MKKILFLLPFLFALFGCSSDDDVLTEAAIRQRAFQRMEQNSVILERSLGRTIEIMEAMGGGMDVLIAQSNSRDLFIRKMFDETENVFDDVIEESRAEMGWDQPTTFEARVAPSGSYIFESYLDAIPVGIEGPNPGSGVIDQFSEFLDAEIERRTMVELEHVLISNYSISGSPASDGAVSVGFSVIAHVKNEIEEMIMEEQDPGKFDDAIEDLVAEKPEAEVLIQMLIPAVQRLRDTNTVQTYLGLTSGDNTMPNFNRDISRAAFLAGLAVILDDDFKPSDEDYASITPQRAMYEAVCVLMWAALYDK